jgi:hypothetical protein
LRNLLNSPKILMPVYESENVILYYGRYRYVNYLLKLAYNFLIYIQQDATLQSLFYVETALHVSGSTITHHQERKPTRCNVTQFILSGNCSTCFGWYHHPSSGAQTNKMQRYTVYFMWKLFYTFRVVPPPIIRSTNNCIYSICYLSRRYCYLRTRHPQQT